MLKNQLEALLFSSGRKMNTEELSRLTNSKPEDIKTALEGLQKEYDEKNSSEMIVNEGDSWKLTVREQFLPLVQKIITETELSKTIMETLAVIAFKYPIKQSDLIKVRTNKAYDHLKELEEMGYISRQKYGRTNLIKLTQKFFDYFDLPKEKLKEFFKDFSSIAKSIEDKEKEIETIKQEQKAKAQEEKQKEEVDLVDEEGNKVALEDYGGKETKKQEEKPQIIEEKEKLGKLDVVEEPSEEEQEKERERIQKIKDEEKHEKEEKKKPKFEGAGIKVTPEMEKIIDKKVDNILHPPKEEDVEPKLEKKKEENKKSDEEPKDLLEAVKEEKKKQENN